MGVSYSTMDLVKIGWDLMPDMAIVLGLIFLVMLYANYNDPMLTEKRTPYTP